MYFIKISFIFVAENKDNSFMDINKLIPDDHNFNKGTDEGAMLLDKSLEELGAGRSILLDKDNRIIAGNKTVESAKRKGLNKIRIVETDGTEIVAVKRTDVSLDTEKGRKLAAADNAVAKKNISWDDEQLKQVSEQFNTNLVEDWGIDLPIMESNINIDEFFDGLGEGEQPQKGFKVTVTCPPEVQDKKDDIINLISQALAQFKVKVSA